MFCVLFWNRNNLELLYKFIKRGWVIRIGGNEYHTSYRSVEHLFTLRVYIDKYESIATLKIIKSTPNLIMIIVLRRSKTLIIYISS